MSRYAILLLLLLCLNGNAVRTAVQTSTYNLVFGDKIRVDILPISSLDCEIINTQDVIIDYHSAIYVNGVIVYRLEYSKYFIPGNYSITILNTNDFFYLTNTHQNNTITITFYHDSNSVIVDHSSKILLVIAILTIPLMLCICSCLIYRSIYKPQDPEAQPLIWYL